LTVAGAGYAPEGALRLARQAEDETLDLGRAPAVQALAEVAALCNDASLHEAGRRLAARR
jgi:hypothetical protein